MADVPTLVLVHSPLLGPECWDGVAAEVSECYPVVVPSLVSALADEPPYWERQVSLVRENLEATSPSTAVVLVGHSGAGPLLGLIGAAVRRAVSGYVLVDADLPEGGAWVDTAPSALVDRLRDLAVDGMVPPWSEWWEEAVLAAALPDETMRSRFRSNLPALPMAMFDEARPGRDDWPDAPCAYLQLSPSYAAPAELARERGWPVETMSGGHLALLTDPSGVARRIVDLVARLG